MKGLKEAPTPPWVQDQSFVSFVVHKLVQLFTMKNTKFLKETLTLSRVRRQSSALLLRASSWHSLRLHVLHGQFACTALHHEEHEVLEGRSPLSSVQGSKLFLILRELCGSKACSYHEGLEGYPDIALDTGNRSFAFLHALHG